MSLEGIAKTEYASLSGKIHTLVIDKTLSISGACADAKATGEAIEKLTDTAADEAAEVATKAAVEAANTAAKKEIDALPALTAGEIAAICV